MTISSNTSAAAAPGPIAGRSVAHVVYGLCAIVIAIFAGANLYVLQTAGTVAEALRKDVEQHLVRNEIDRQVEMVARDQSQVSHWDASVKALGERIDADFVQDEIVDWLWGDFGIQTTIVVAPDGTGRLTVFKDRLLKPGDGRNAVRENADLIKEAQNRYMQRREAREGGFFVPDESLPDSDPVYASGIRILDGQIGVMVVQAIVPSDAALLPDGPPQTLLTFKPLGPRTFAAIADKLGLTSFKIGAVAPVAEGLESLGLDGGAGSRQFQAVWRIASPSEEIWRRAMPSLLTLLALVGVALLFVALRFGRMLTALQDSLRRNRFLALHDALTGLPNRLQFDRCLEDIIAEGAQARCAILCLDLDRFKSINDTYGHQAGDAVIKTVADRISRGVGGAGMTARIGGDEFIILLRDKLDRDHVLWLCDTLIESVCEPVRFEGGAGSVGASIGVAWWPDDALTAKTIIRSADEALYRAKENGRGRAYLAGEADSVKDRPSEPVRIAG